MNLHVIVTQIRWLSRSLYIYFISYFFYLLNYFKESPRGIISFYTFTLQYALLKKKWTFPNITTMLMLYPNINNYFWQHLALFHNQISQVVPEFIFITFKREIIMPRLSFQDRNFVGGYIPISHENILKFCCVAGSLALKILYSGEPSTRFGAEHVLSMCNCG